MTNERRCRQVPRLPRKSAAASRATKRTQARHQTQPSPTSITPVTQNGGGGRQIPRLPRKSTAASRATKRTQARNQTQPSPKSTMPATQNDSGCRQVPRLPRKTTVDVAKYHACHAKVPRASRATKRTQARHMTDPAQSHECHACHAKRRWMSPSTTPATQVDVAKRPSYHAKVLRSHRRQGGPVAKYHACYTKRRYTQLPKSWRNPKNLEICLGEGFCGSRGDVAFSLCLG